MPRKQNPNRRRGKGGRVSNRNDQTVRMRFRLNPFDTSLSTTGVSSFGAIYQGPDGTVTSGSLSIDMSPATINGRFADVCALFEQYRVNKLKVDYRSALGSDGLLAGGAVSTSPAYFNSNLAFGCTPDPVPIPTDYSDLVQLGCKETNVRSNSSFNFRTSRDWMNGWRYTVFGGGTTNSADLRDYAFGSFNAGYPQVALSSVSTFFGNFIFTMDVEFRWPTTRLEPPMRLPRPPVLPASEEKKDEIESSPVLVSENPDRGDSLSCSSSNQISTVPAPQRSLRRISLHGKNLQKQTPLLVKVDARPSGLLH